MKKLSIVSGAAALLLMGNMVFAAEAATTTATTTATAEPVVAPVEMKKPPVEDKNNVKDQTAARKPLGDKNKPAAKAVDLQTEMQKIEDLAEVE